MSSIVSRINLFLLTAAGLVNACNIAPKTAEQKMAEDPMGYIMSDEHKNDIYQKLINSPIDKNALAKIDTAKAGEHDLDLTNMSWSTMSEEGISKITNPMEQTLEPDLLEDFLKSDPKAKIFFDYDQKRHSASMAELMDVVKDYKKLAKETHPEYEASLLFYNDSQVGIGANYDDEQKQKKMTSYLSVGSLVYLSKAGLNANLAAHIGYLNNKDIHPTDQKTRIDNRLRADSAAAEMTSPEDVILSHVQVSTGFQAENRKMIGKERDTYLNSTKSFGFETTIDGKNPGQGRSIQYMEAFEQYKQKHVDHLSTPPGQKFTPKK